MTSVHNNLCKARAKASTIASPSCSRRPSLAPPSSLVAKLRVHEQVNERAMFLKGVTLFLFFPSPIHLQPLDLGWALALY